MDRLKKPLLKASHISKTFPFGQTKVLNDISFQVNRGEFLSIRGPSGSGKTTLLYIIAGLIPASNGEVFINGKALSSIANLALLRRKEIGFIFQDFYLYPGFTVLENILLPISNRLIIAKKWKIKAETLLGYLGMHQKAHQNINQLSCGERQRVCIARALLNDPPIILADEPTGSLDSDNSTKILKLLQKINQEKQITIIMVTHDNKVARYSSGTINIVDGKIVDNDES